MASSLFIAFTILHVFSNLSFKPARELVSLNWLESKYIVFHTINTNRLKSIGTDLIGSSKQNNVELLIDYAVYNVINSK